MAPPLHSSPSTVRKRVHGLDSDEKTTVQSIDTSVKKPFYVPDAQEGMPSFPLEAPPLSLKDLRQAIPAHCFTRPLWKSTAYLIKNSAICAALFYISSLITYLPWQARILAWPVYWFLQGSYLTGIWVIAHECGHGGFSDYKIVNDVVGTVLHSLLLVPYDSWRITHRRHHSNTGSCENDEVFTPKSRSVVEPTWDDMLEDSPLYNLFGITRMLVVGWIPGYLVFNASGPEKYYGKNANHFSPSAVMFSKKEYSEVQRTLVAFAVAVVALLFVAKRVSFSLFFFAYFIPYLIVNAYLVLITYLQHTDVYVPHFREKEWNWFRGALCTVDRSFGPWLDAVLHHITDSHVVHHLFSSMPFYHAVEATPIVREKLGKYYMKDDTPIPQALYRAFSNCKFVEDDEDIVFYKRRMDQ